MYYKNCEKLWRILIAYTDTLSQQSGYSARRRQANDIGRVQVDKAARLLAEQMIRSVCVT